MVFILGGGHKSRTDSCTTVDPIKIYVIFSYFMCAVVRSVVETHTFPTKENVICST